MYFQFSKKLVLCLKSESKKDRLFCFVCFSCRPDVSFNNFSHMMSDNCCVIGQKFKGVFVNIRAGTQIE